MNVPAPRWEKQAKIQPRDALSSTGARQAKRWIALGAGAFGIGCLAVGGFASSILGRLCGGDEYAPCQRASGRLVGLGVGLGLAVTGALVLIRSARSSASPHRTRYLAVALVAVGVVAVMILAVVQPHLRRSALKTTEERQQECEMQLQGRGYSDLQLVINDPCNAQSR